MTKARIEFGFTIRNGTNICLTSGTWRVWVRKEDAYIAPTKLGGMWKCSLRGDLEHPSSRNPVSRRLNRSLWKFVPTPFVNGRRLAFVVCTFRDALLRDFVDQNAMHVAVEDRWDQVNLGCVWMTEPHTDISSTDECLLGGPLVLASGRRVWVTAKTESISGGKPEPQAIASIIEPTILGAHGVAAPGVIHRGVRLAYGALAPVCR